MTIKHTQTSVEEVIIASIVPRKREISKNGNFKFIVYLYRWRYQRMRYLNRLKFGHPSLPLYQRINTCSEQVTTYMSSLGAYLCVGCASSRSQQANTLGEISGRSRPSQQETYINVNNVFVPIFPHLLHDGISREISTYGRGKTYVLRKF
jgi:hypothetical protein